MAKIQKLVEYETMSGLAGIEQQDQNFLPKDTGFSCVIQHLF